MVDALLRNHRHRRPHRYRRHRHSTTTTAVLIRDTGGVTALEVPENIATAFAEAWNAHDADRLAALFVPDADFVNVVGLWWRDRQQIRQAHAAGFERIFTSATMTLRKVTVRYLSADAAVVHAAWTLVGQNSLAGHEAETRRGVISFVTIHDEASGWIAVSAHNTDRINGAETHLATKDAVIGANYLTASRTSPDS